MTRKQLTLVVATLALAVQQAARADLYAVTDLGNVDARGINNAGQVVGINGSDPFIWSVDLGLRDLGLLPAGVVGGYASSLNDNQTVVGTLNYNGSLRAFKWTSSQGYQPTPFGQSATAINQAGDIVGSTGGPFAWGWLASDPPNNSGHLVTQSTWNSSARSINDAGYIVNAIYANGYNVGEIMAPDGTSIGLPSFGGNVAQPTSINNLNQVVGSSNYSYGSYSHAFLYQNGTSKDLGILGGNASNANAINNRGIIVGVSDTDAGPQHAFISSGSGMTDLNTLLLPNSNWTLNTANALNDAGQIVGVGVNPSGQSHAFLLTPTPVPMPTEAPAINNLPSIQHFYPDLQTTLNQHAADFSADSIACLISTTTATASLINPASPAYLKSHASSIADNLSLEADTIDGVMAIVSPGKLGMKALNLGLTAIGRLLPPNNLYTTTFSTDVLAISTAASLHLDTFDPTTFLISANTYIYGTLVANELRNYGKDPADPNFLTVVAPVITPITGLPTTGNTQLDAALAVEITASLPTATYLQAVNQSFDKYAGAIEAGDNLHATLQMEALLYFLGQYDQSARDALAAMSATQTLLTLLGIANGNYDPQQMVTFQQDIATNGLPDDLLATLTALGLTGDQIDQVKDGILARDPNSIFGTVAGANDSAISTLSQATTAAPEPASIGILVLGIFYTLCGRRRMVL